MMHSMTTTVDVEEALRCVGRMNDDAIDLAEAALMLAAFDRPDAPVDNYRDHLTRPEAGTGSSSDSFIISIVIKIFDGHACVPQ